jgi:hypothetical protein
VRRALLLSLLLLLPLALEGRLQAAQCVDPRMLILFDSSGSLGSKANASSNYNAAVGAVLSVANSEGDHIAMGLLLFPAAPAAMQCQTSAALAVPFKVDNYTNFKAFFDGYAGPHGKSDTPMLQALKLVSDAAPAASGLGQLKQAEVPGYVVLVTDGIQDCCADELLGTGFGWDTQADCNEGEPFGSANYYNQAELAQNRTEQIQIVANLLNEDIKTFVVGFGTKVDPQALNDMAVAGGTPRVPGCGVGAAVGPCYYQADNAAALEAALADIAAQVGQEICNGKDDDCDGATDEGLTKECQAACGTGTQVCNDGTWSACPVSEPKAETCDGVDNNCDGTVDEWLVKDCSTACGTGYAVCEGGDWVDCTAPQPKTEACNGKDDDCDGSTDEGCACNNGDSEPCGTPTGACEPGTRTCVDGAWSDCEGAEGPAVETCNGEDDDCDGVVDGMEQSCSTACGTGSEKCIDGEWTGCTAPKPNEEQCNNADDDCDGDVDEDVTRECETACAVGTEFCAEGKWRDCSATKPTLELCDGLDNDCDGVADEDTELPCASDCGQGVRSCDGGEYGECSVTMPAAEACDGLDNDCNGVADDGAQCPEGLACLCGGCAGPAEGGVCEFGTESDGFCVIDLCPGGKFCVDGTCQDTEGEADTGTGEADAGGGGGGIGIGGDAGDTSFGTDGDGSGPSAAVADGCGCDQTAPLGSRTTAGAALMWLLVGLAVVGRSVLRRT